MVVRALPSVWRTGILSDDELGTAAAGWNAVGRATAELGIAVSLHVDALSAAAAPAVIDALLARTDPSLVGLTVDTAELTLAGIEPVAVVRAYGERVNHVRLKDTRYVDDDGERLQPHAERTFGQEGGRREVERWFYECGTRGGLVDVPGVVAALDDVGYRGWLVFESEQSPNPARSAMLNGWFAHHRLGAGRPS